jgi:hypothetical protein
MENMMEYLGYLCIKMERELSFRPYLRNNFYKLLIEIMEI